MKRKRQTFFVPIRKVDSQGGMVAGDRRKMIESHQQAMAQDANLRAELLDLVRESMKILRAMAADEARHHEIPSDPQPLEQAKCRRW